MKKSKHLRKSIDLKKNVLEVFLPTFFLQSIQRLYYRNRQIFMSPIYVLALK